MQAPTPHATAIAYPLVPTPSGPPEPSPSLDPNYFNLGMEQSTFSTNDSIDLGNNFFSQLDSMIAAVKVETNALDTMREKLKEVDNLRSQISTFTKRLIDADQMNLNLKSNLVKSQEAYNELKKQKAEVESNAVSMRQELNRTKDALNKERVARQQLQQEIQNIKEQYARLEVLRDNLDREVKTIPAITESNEILKNDMATLRRRYKEEKASLTKHIKQLESQNKDTENLKNEVRNLAMRLMEISGGGSTVGGSGLSSMMPSNIYNNNAPPTKYDPQASNYSLQSNNTNNYNMSNMNNMRTQHQPHLSHQQEDDDEDDFSDGGNLGGHYDNESDYDQNSLLDDYSVASAVNTSMDSAPMLSMNNNNNMVMMNSSNNNHTMAAAAQAKQSSGKKKKVKKAVVTSTKAVSGQNMGSQSMNMQNMNGGGGGGMGQSFSLPRI